MRKRRGKRLVALVHDGGGAIETVGDHLLLDIVDRFRFFRRRGPARADLLAQHAGVFGDTGTSPGLAEQVAIYGFPVQIHPSPVIARQGEEAEESNLECS